VVTLFVDFKIWLRYCLRRPVHRSFEILVHLDRNTTIIKCFRSCFFSSITWNLIPPPKVEGICISAVQELVRHKQQENPWSVLCVVTVGRHTSVEVYDGYDVAVTWSSDGQSQRWRKGVPAKHATKAQTDRCLGSHAVKNTTNKSVVIYIS